MCSEEDMMDADVVVQPDGKGLPEGSGTVAHSKSVYQQNCEICHGPNGKDCIKDRLVGGQGSLATDSPIKTVGGGGSRSEAALHGTRHHGEPQRTCGGRHGHPCERHGRAARSRRGLRSTSAVIKLSIDGESPTAGAIGT